LASSATNRSQSSEPGGSPPAVVYERVTRAANLPNMVRSQILQMIASSQLAPGDRLKPERELASEIGVSRNVVREAIRSLVDANVLEARQGAGVFVASLHVESLIEPLEVVLALESATLNSLAQARLVIEPGIAALAAQHGSDDDIAALQALVAEGREHGPDDMDRLLEIDVELHNRMVRMTENPFLIRIMESIGKLARSSREFTNTVPHMREEAQADHEHIVEALAARDPDAARAAMTEHLTHVALTLAERAIEDVSSDDGT
jgi:GntR family transcriptional regulator, transcriptional repressor for pyruvate dehydrogenase complex